MALADSETIEQTRKGPRCGVCLALELMDDDDAATLTRWMGDKQLFSSTIEKRLMSQGIRHLSAGQITRHRGGRCWEQRRAIG